MLAEQIPIAIYVEQQYSSRRIQKIVEGWRVEPNQVIAKMTEHFREMGIYFVNIGHEQLLLDNIIQYLRHSPDIHQLVQKARNEELKRQRSRHAE